MLCWSDIMRQTHKVTAMDLTWFRDLSHLARTGNFSRAAQLSNVSQPALSRRIKAMEAWVGALLVDRSRHPVVLTGAGMQMLEAGQQALARLDSERKSIREAQSLPDRDVVTFAAQHSIAWRFYPTWLQAFEDTYGPIISRLRADDLPNCLQDLEAGTVDFVLAYASRRASAVASSRDVDSVRIGRDSLIPVSKAGADARPMFDIDRKQPATIPYLRFGAAAPISQHLAPLLEARNIQNKLQMVYENSMAGALRIRAREGIGIAWLPKSLVAPDLETGILVLAGGKKWEVALDIKLYRVRRHANTITNKIWSFLERRQDKPLLGATTRPR